MKNNIFKKSLCLVSAFVLLMSLTACGSSKATVNNDATQKSFTVGFDAEYPPFGYMAEDGTYTGFDLEIAEEVCKMENWKLVKQPIDWDSKDLELNSGNIDCIWNGFTIDGRENDYTWSIPYIDNSIVFVVKKDSSIKTAEDLKGLSVVTQAGSSGYSALESDDNKALTESFGLLELTPDYNTAFMNIESGLCDCVVVDIGVAKYQIQKNPDKFRMLEKPFTSERYAIGFKKGNTELKDTVEKDVLELYKNGKFMEIANKYKDYSVPDMICLK